MNRTAVPRASSSNKAKEIMPHSSSSQRATIKDCSTCGRSGFHSWTNEEEPIKVSPKSYVKLVSNLRECGTYMENLAGSRNIVASPIVPEQRSVAGTRKRPRDPFTAVQITSFPVPQRTISTSSSRAPRAWFVASELGCGFSAPVRGQLVAKSDGLIGCH